MPGSEHDKVKVVKSDGHFYEFIGFFKWNAITDDKTNQFTSGIF